MIIIKELTVVIRQCACGIGAETGKNCPYISSSRTRCSAILNSAAVLWLENCNSDVVRCLSLLSRDFLNE